jgi:hypothetical protein
MTKFKLINNFSFRRSQWPRGLKRRSSAARLLRLWVRIPPGHGSLSAVIVVCCQVEVSATDWSLVQRSPAECGASLCVIKKPRKRGGWSPLPGCENTTTMGCNARKTNKQTTTTMTCCSIMSCGNLLNPFSSYASWEMWRVKKLQKISVFFYVKNSNFFFIFTVSLCISIHYIQGIHKRMAQFQKLTRNLFLTLHGHNLHRQQRQLSKFLMR